MTRKHIWEMLEKLEKGLCFKSDVMDAVDAYYEAGNSGKPMLADSAASAQKCSDCGKEGDEVRKWSGGYGIQCYSCYKADMAMDEQD
jgi:phenolic acid decarboxylase